MPRKKKTVDAKIRDLISKEAQNLGVSFTPLYPWVAVRILPKERQINGIWLPDNNQHKPLYEAIVLQTWNPRRVHEYDPESGEIVDRVITSQVKRGDHILFPHWDGFPLPNLPESTHRIVREFIWDAKGGIPFILHVDQVSIRAKLEEFLFENGHTSGRAHQLAMSLLSRFSVVDTNVVPATIRV